MRVRGIRGATTVEKNNADDILRETKKLLLEMIRRNDVSPDDIASVIITVTHDLNATFPARAIRTMPGWEYVPLMCAQEIPVEGSLPKCIRMLIHVNTEKSPQEIHHVYLKDTTSLRPDLAQSP